jgi:hypothetical protein
MPQPATPRPSKLRKPRLFRLFRWLGVICLMAAATAVQAATAVAVAEVISAQTLETKAPDKGPFAVVVGGKTMLLPRPEGYVGLQEMPAEFRAIIEDSIPPQMRLLQTMVHVDALTLNPPEYAEDIAIDTYVPRSLENDAYSDAEWASMRSNIAAGLRRQNIAPYVEKSADLLNDALQTHVGAEIRYEAGKPGEHVVYREDARSVRMYLVLPSRQTIAGEVYEVEMVRVMSISLMRGRMVYLGASLEFPAGKADIAAVVERMDAYIEDTHRLNPAQDD